MHTIAGWEECRDLCLGGEPSRGSGGLDPCSLALVHWYRLRCVLALAARHLRMYHVCGRMGHTCTDNAQKQVSRADTDQQEQLKPLRKAATAKGLDCAL